MRPFTELEMHIHCILTSLLYVLDLSIRITSLLDSLDFPIDVRNADYCRPWCINSEDQ